MIKKIILMAVVIVQSIIGFSQSISRSDLNTAGGTLTGGGISLNYSMGVVAGSTLVSGNAMVTQGFQQPGEQIRTGVVPVSICRGSQMIIPFTATDIASVNTFTAELSDSAGNFSSPIAIGNINSNSSGSITATIPSNIPSGSKYRVRVTGSFPLTKGTDNGSDIAIASGETPVVEGPTNICQFIGNGTPVIYTAAAGVVNSYNWNLPPNVSVLSGTGTNQLTVTFASGFATQANKQIRITTSSSCGTSAQTIYYLLAQAPGTAQPITAGSDNICSIIGTGGTIQYSIPKVTSATEYIWNAQPGNTIISHPNGTGVNDTLINVSFTNGFTTSAITVNAANGCGVSAARSILVTKANPSTPGLISGPVNVCANIAPNGTAATYSVAPVANTTSYTWVVPANAIGLTGQGTSSISFSYPAGFSNGSVNVSASNGCGTSTPRSLSVTKLNPATPSVMDVVQTHFCDEQDGRKYTYSLSAMPSNATSIVWTVPPVASFVQLSPISIEVSYPATSVTGTVTAQAINNCGSSTVRSSAVKLPACQPPAFTRNTVANSNAQTKVSQESVTAPEKAGSLEATVFPNPTTNNFSLLLRSSSKETITVTIYDAQGRILKRLTAAANQTSILGSDLEAGMYLAVVKQGKETVTQKIIKY